MAYGVSWPGAGSGKHQSSAWSARTSMTTPMPIFFSTDIRKYRDIVLRMINAMFDQVHFPPHEEGNNTDEPFLIPFAHPQPSTFRYPRSDQRYSDDTCLRHTRAA